MFDSDQCQGIPAFNLLENILWSSMRVYDSWVEQLGVVNYKYAEVSLNRFIHLIFPSPSFCWFLLQTPIFPAGLVWCKILKCWSRCWKQHPTVGIPQITTSCHLVVYEAHFCGKTLLHFFYWPSGLKKGGSKIGDVCWVFQLIHRFKDLTNGVEPDWMWFEET